MRKRTRIVPSLVVTASFVGVVPACALVSCGGATISQDGGSDAKNDILFGVADVGFGVAAVAYCCFDSGGVADAAFADAPSDAPEGG